VGTVQGGTSVNAIAAQARMTLDMRSNSPDELRRVEEQILQLVRDAVAEESRRWGSDKLGVEIKLIGDRPAGAVPDDAPIVQISRRAISALSRGIKITLAGASNKTRNINKCDRGRSDLFAVVHLCENLETLIRDGDNTSIWLDSCKRVVCRQDIIVGKGVKESRFANIREAYDAD